MSDLSRTVPQEQLPPEDLHPLPTPVINLGHLSLESTTRSRVVDDIAKACHDLGYFQCTMEADLSLVEGKTDELNILVEAILQKNSLNLRSFDVRPSLEPSS